MTTYIQLNSSDPSVLDHSTGGDFTVQLGKSFNFSNDYEVYLSEGVFPFTWHNVTSANNELTVGSKKIKLAEAYYESIPILLKALTAALKSASLSAIKMTVDPITMKVTIDAGATTVRGMLLRMLGFPKGATITGKMTAPGMVDITGGVSSLYVLVDCVENSTAGSFSVPLLKKIEVTRVDRPGDLMHFRAHEPVEAHRLNQQSLMHVEVNIKNALGRTVDFNGSHVDLTLGIRRIRS